MAAARRRYLYVNSDIGELQAMSVVHHGRFTAQVDQPLVLFLIGMRINRFRAIRKWLPVARETGPMLTTLFQHPEKGLLHVETLLGWRTVVTVQYWRSFDDLERFARSTDDPHAAARQHISATGSRAQARERLHADAPANAPANA